MTIFGSFYTQSIACGQLDALGSRSCRCQEAKRRSIQRPSKLVEDICNGRPDHELLRSSVTLPRLLEHSRNQLTTTFIHYIVDGYQPTYRPNDVPRHYPLWEAPLKGLTNILQSIAEIESTNHGWSIIKEIRAAYPSIILVIYQDLRRLLVPGIYGDNLRNLIICFLSNIMFAKDFKRLISFVHVVSL